MAQRRISTPSSTGPTAPLPGWRAALLCLLASLLGCSLLAPYVLAQPAFNPVQCPISLAGAAGALSCQQIPGGHTCNPATEVYCQYDVSQPNTLNYCCSLEPAYPTKAQRRRCFQGCEAAYKTDRKANGCLQGQAGYKSCQLVAKAKLNDCKGFCVF